MSDKVLLSARQLIKRFPSADGRVVNAVNDVSFDVYQGETLAIVGESGCGKSTLGRLLLHLNEPTSGEVLYQDRTLGKLTKQELRGLRKDLQMIFQDPFASLNPRMTVFDTLAEPLKIHQRLSGKALTAAVNELLDLVGLASTHANSYPQEFSGGQRQRIAIARALASKPKLVIGDEPLSALDVSVQAQVINLLNELKSRLGLTLVLISHDLSVIEHMADRVIVMYLGQIVEIGTTDEIFNRPRHPYTQALLGAIPHPVPGFNKLRTLAGELPNPKQLPQGCYFRSRCQYAESRCEKEIPKATSFLSETHAVACFQLSQVDDFIPITLHDHESPAYRLRKALYQHFSQLMLREHTN